MLLRPLGNTNKPIKILDIGAGSGSNYELLTNFGAVTGIEPSPIAVKLAIHKGITDLVVASAEQIPFENDTFNLVTLMDVLEHLPDENKALSEAYRVLSKEGRIFVTVPALKILWTNHDAINNHYRRYSKREITEILEAAGFQIEKISFYFLTAFPFYLTRSLLEKRGLLNKRNLDYLSLPNLLINQSIFMILAIEARILKYISLPFGSSLVVVAKK